jgi:hypothetical protein
VLKLAATVLASAGLPESKEGAFLDLHNKFLILAEAGNDLIDGSGTNEEISSLKNSMTFMVDILPLKSSIKEAAERSKYRWTPTITGEISELKAEDFLDPEEAKEDGSPDQVNEDDILACAVDLANNATTASASSGLADEDKGQIKEKGVAASGGPKEQKLRLSIAHQVKFEAGIDAFVAE